MAILWNPVHRLIIQWSRLLVDHRSTTRSADLPVDCSVQSDLDFPPRIPGEVCDFLSFPSNFYFMAPTVFAEKDFSRLFSDVHRYDHIFWIG